MTFEENLKTLKRTQELQAQAISTQAIIETLVRERFSLASILNAATVELDTFVFPFDGKLVVTKFRSNSALAQRYQQDISGVIASIMNTEVTIDEVQSLVRGLEVMQELAALTDVAVIPLQG